ncbi:MAG: sulfurtransferase [Pyrobaculum sp.]|uniref:Sulfurtransferase n=2 Tax=Pyrobaculum arsenaticum TaxID=121277 RepID=A4WJB6_PYRAR|nr:sulfurtransferase [Pyrobaculum arsenaticum]ABP50483.1 Thiosulfate sulfurtransferase [Pyrobaculum arsenaticum DSM 13514]MCY0890476.1 sulfurtransferase [Pyrobaculum arsenaticum]NYR14576.1 sulfurtransferase [Pyrobaculum arsenaticum]
MYYMALVTTEWVHQNLNNPKVRIVEVDYDPNTAYNVWHVPGAVLITWKELRHPVRRDFIEPEDFERLMSEKGISNDHTVVLYGDFNNWFAAYAFWLFETYGHEDIRLMDGGRTAWAKEGRPTTQEVPRYPKTQYKVRRVDWGSRRAYLWEVMNKVVHGEIKKSVLLIDVRSPAEYKGEITAPPEYPNEQTQVGGHIPGAVNIPWGQAVDPNTGKFKPPEELKKLYESAGITPDKEVITYCRIGERAAHTWFVLKHILKYPAVRVYDGSWAEWGNLVGAPVEK